MLTYEQVKKQYQDHIMAFYRNPSEFYIEPFRIYGPVYYVGDKVVCVHLIDTGAGLLLIDSGFGHSIHMLVDSIFRLGFDPRDIKCILHTHGHFDHFGASNEFRRLYGCDLAISRTDAELMKTNDRISSLSWFAPVAPLAYDPPEFQILLDDGDDFKMGNITIHCVSIPGHTAGTMAFFFDVTENGQTLRAGLFGGAGLGSLRRVTLEHRAQPLHLQEDMLRSIERVRGEHVDIQLGNHPENNDTVARRMRQLREGGNPFIDSSAWGTFLDATRAKFEEYFARERAEEQGV